MRSRLCLLLVLLLPGVALAKEKPAGKRPDKTKKTSGPTYYKDVAPIFQQRCGVCHRPGAIGPFALQTYRQAAGWSAMIGEVVENRRMPPWHASPRVGSFKNSRRLPEAERKTILDWIKRGTPAGDAKDAPPKKTYHDAKGWQIGEPDVVYSIRKPFQVPATGVVDYKYNFVATDQKEDRWVTGVEVKVGAPQVVHHVLIFVRYPNPRESPRVRGGLAGFFASNLPGESVEPFPPGAAKFLPKGAILVFQIHYTPNGKPQSDQTRIGLKFAKPTDVITRRVRTVSLYSTRFRIPPHAKAHPVKASHYFKEDKLVTGLLPHMHLRGKSFTYLLQYPDGGLKPLLSIPRYDFNWQNTYRFTKPLYVPAGSRILGTATFDNSKENPANPDPTKEVKFGEQTWDEMMIGYIDTLDPTDADRAAWQAKQKK